MVDNLKLIRTVIDQHKAIREHIGRVGDSVTDREALDTLEKARADWTPGRFEALSERRSRLQQTMSFLEDGLKKHFAFEEKALPRLLGDLLMRALELQHREIRREIDEARSVVADIQLEGLSREELLAKESRIQQRIGVTLQLVEEHTTREELVLEMIQKALEEKT